MIIVRYEGGLGNQMFQYAMQLSLTNKYKGQEVKGDNSYFFLNKEHNGFELERHWGIDINVATKEEIKKVYNGIILTSKTNKIKRFIIKRIEKKYQYLMDKFFRSKMNCIIRDDEKFNNYVDKIEMLDTDNWYLSGFWQRTDYFEKYRESILKVFKLNCVVSPEEINIVEKLKNGQLIAVHVRGGDFINSKNNSKHNLCDYNYYEQAINEINKENLPLIVFTDDKEYSKKILSKHNIVQYINHGVENSLIDMYMLSMAKKVIISNSTFAFWGAYLSNIKEQQVICPKYATCKGEDYRYFPKRDFWKVIENIPKNK